MKTILAIAFVLVCAAASAQQTTNLPSVVLGWNAVSDPSVNAYRIHWGVQSRQYTNFLQVAGRTTTTAAVSNLVRNVTYFFAASSVATNGLTSDFSNEVSYRTLGLPPAPSGVTVQVLEP